MKIQRINLLLSTSSILVLLLSACASPTAAPTSMPTATTTQTATATLPLPSATATTLPTNTPAPTATPTLAPTPQGGGGKLVLTLFPSAYTAQFTLDGDANVFALNPDGSDMKPLTNGPKGLVNLAAAVSPDGTRVAYTQSKMNPRYFASENPPGDLFTFKLDGSGLVQLTTPQLKAFRQGVTWLPDGRLLFFGTDEKGPSIFLVDAEGGNIIRLKKPAGYILGSTLVMGLSPDRSGIYWLTGDGCLDRYVCNEHYYWTKLDDSEHKQVWKNVKNAASDIQIAPDGQHFAYRSLFNDSSNPNQGCFVAKIDGSGVQKMGGDWQNCLKETFSASSGDSSWWSPDGSQFVYEMSDRKLNNRVFKIWSAADGKSTDVPDLQTGSCGNLFWFPDGKQILFFNCQSTQWGRPSPSPIRILNIESGKVTQGPDTGFCGMRFSPDFQQALFFNCKQAIGSSAISIKITSFTNMKVVPGLENIVDPIVQAFWTAAP